MVLQRQLYSLTAFVCCSTNERVLIMPQPVLISRLFRLPIWRVFPRKNSKCIFVLRVLKLWKIATLLETLDGRMGIGCLILVSSKMKLLALLCANWNGAKILRRFSVFGKQIQWQSVGARRLSIRVDWDCAIDDRQAEIGKTEAEWEFYGNFFKQKYNGCLERYSSLACKRRKDLAIWPSVMVAAENSYIFLT